MQLTEAINRFVNMGCDLAADLPHVRIDAASAATVAAQVRFVPHLTLWLITFAAVCLNDRFSRRDAAQTFTLSSNSRAARARSENVKFADGLLAAIRPSAAI